MNNLVNPKIVDNFDIVLFSAKHFFFSRIIEYFTNSPYSHVGLILKSPTYISPKLTGTYLWESGEEIVDNKIKLGVQLTEWDNLFKNYDGRIWMRKLMPNLDIDVNKEKIVEIYNNTINKPYDLDIFDFICADLQLDIGNCRKTDKFFCSALCGYIYEKMGIIENNVKWDLLEPKMFAGNELKLNGYELKKLINVK